MNTPPVLAPDGVTLVLRACAPRCARLDLLSVRWDLRGRGLARATLSAIAAWADECGVHIHLSVETGLGGDRHRLVPLYSSAGFRTVPGTSGAMIRRPRAA